MADPVTLMIGAATLLATGGTILETQAARSDAQSEAQIAKANAEAVGLQTGQAEDAQRRRNREILARQSALIGEANIGRSGSALKLQQQTAAELELEALNIRYGGEIDRRSLVAEEKLARRRKTAIGVTGFLRAGSQLLGGGAQTGSAYRRLPRGP